MNPYELIKQILKENDFGRLVEGLTKDQMISMIKDEFLGEIDIKHDFQTNQKVIYDKFYDKNSISIYSILSQDDVYDLYEATQKLILGK